MKGIVLLSDGIDSPVASYLMLKKNVDLVFVNVSNSKNSTKEEKIKKLIGVLSKRFNKELRVYFLNYYDVQKEFFEKCIRRFQCILCKRTMYRLAKEIAQKENADFLVTGENMGQVASQTLHNMIVLSKAVKLNVLRPLLCFEKNDTIRIAKEIGTYEISIQDASDCPFVPSNPATRTKIEIIEREEKRVDIENLVKEAIKYSKIEVIKP